MSLLTDTREKLQTRIDKLDEQLAPLQTERDELMLVMDALNAPNTPQPVSRSRSTGGTRRKRVSGENRADAMFELVAAEPGLTGSEIARRLNTQAGYISRLGKQLLEEGRLRRDDKKGYFANNGSAPVS
jgi:predicted transcriptional regulator